VVKGGEIGSPGNSFLQLDYLLRTWPFGRGTPGDKIEVRTCARADAQLTTTFTVAVHENAQRLPERSEQMLVGDNPPAHHHDRGNRLIDELFQCGLGHAASIRSRARGTQKLCTSRLKHGCRLLRRKQPTSPRRASGPFQAGAGNDLPRPLTDASKLAIKC
jgi:hypothetical protein